MEVLILSAAPGEMWGARVRVTPMEVLIRQVPRSAAIWGIGRHRDRPVGPMKDGTDFLIREVAFQGPRHSMEVLIREVATFQGTSTSMKGEVLILEVAAFQGTSTTMKGRERTCLAG